MRARNVATVLLLMALMTTACAADQVFDNATAYCEPSEALGLISQAVPTATQLPCVHDVQHGWLVNPVDAENARAAFLIDSDRAGMGFLKVTLTAACDVADAAPVSDGRQDIDKFVATQTITPEDGDIDRLEGTWYHKFAGGCVTYEFAAEGPDTYIFELPELVTQTVDFISRQELADFVSDELGYEIWTEEPTG